MYNERGECRIIYFRLVANKKDDASSYLFAARCLSVPLINLICFAQNSKTNEYWQIFIIWETNATWNRILRLPVLDP